jgi:flagellar hook-associated protein 1 FlgK
MISDIQSQTLANGNTASDFYHALVGDIGNSVQEAGFMRNNQEMLVQSLQNQKDSVSGVSLDEEMTRLVEFERGYEAAARMISVIDDLMNTTINMV